MQSNNFILFEKTYSLLLWLYPTIKKFPKSDKYTIGEELKETTLNILKYIMLFNKTKDKKYLKKADIYLDILRIQLRLSNDLKILDSKKYEFSSKQVFEIGNLLGGFLNKQSTLNVL